MIVSVSSSAISWKVATKHPENINVCQVKSTWFLWKVIVHQQMCYITSCKYSICHSVFETIFVLDCVIAHANSCPTSTWRNQKYLKEFVFSCEKIKLQKKLQAY